MSRGSWILGHRHEPHPHRMQDFTCCSSVSQWQSKQVKFAIGTRHVQRLPCKNELAGNCAVKQPHGR